MRNVLALLVVTCAGIAHAGPGTISSATEVAVKPGTPVEVTGKLDGGVEVDLSWAANSGMACFPATQFDRFSGNHVVYAVDMPERAILTISFSSSADISLYSYQVPLAERGSLPPKASGISCTATGKSRAPIQMTTIERGYRTYIGVAGAKGVKSGAFTLKLELAGGPVAKKSGAITSVTDVAVKPGTPVEVKGKLDGGVEVDVSWAATSGMACFPGTQFEHFDGNHVMYAVDMPERAILKVTATPADAQTDISLYSYQVPLGTTSLPPKVSGISCTASYGGNRKVRNPGAAESLQMTTIERGYRTYIGIAGPRGVKTGAFTLKLDLLGGPVAKKTGQVAQAIEVPVKSGVPVEVKGKLDGGVEIDLSWAATSGMACFPGTQFEHFEGNHVVYAVDMPEHAILKITATPADAQTDISLYSYQVSLGDKGHLPPKVDGISCEASYGGNRKVRNPGAAESIQTNTIERGYRTYIGVAGPRGVKTGSFTMKFDLVGGPVAKKPGQITKVEDIVVKPGTPVEVKGKIDGGIEIDLSWAATAGMACFPGTQFEHFDGNHVMYAFDMPERAIAKITVTPADAQTDVSIYSYQTSLGTTSLPPKVDGLSCEASYGGNMKVRNPGKPEAITQTTIERGYRTFVGIAGPRGVKTGSFTLRIEVTGGPVAVKPGKITQVQDIAVTPGKPVEVKGKLDGGVEVDLAQLQRECFPGTQVEHFDGAHVMYAVDMPERAVLDIDVTPADAQTDVSIYSYQTVLGDKTTLPPNVHAMSCVASYGGNRKVRNPGAPEHLRQVTIERGYRTYIGVAGPRGVKTGAFAIKVTLQGGPKTIKQGVVASATKIDAAPNATTEVKGSIDGGVEVDLRWASTSGNACFPGTGNEHFDGNHVVYWFDMPPRAVADITVTPADSSTDISLYAYQATIGDVKNLPPNVSGISCDASYGGNLKVRNPGAPEHVKMTTVDTPYRTFIGIAGPRDVKKGSFTIKIVLKK